jgi:hypothetical protein
MTGLYPLVLEIALETADALAELTYRLPVFSIT